MIGYWHKGGADRPHLYISLSVLRQRDALLVRVVETPLRNKAPPEMLYGYVFSNP